MWVLQFLFLSPNSPFLYKKKKLNTNIFCKYSDLFQNVRKTLSFNIRTSRSSTQESETFYIDFTFLVPLCKDLHKQMAGIFTVSIILNF